jgi:hypothetical protein
MSDERDAVQEREARRIIDQMVADGILVRLESGWITLRKFHDPERDGREAKPKGERP